MLNVIYKEYLFVDIEKKFNKCLKYSLIKDLFKCFRLLNFTYKRYIQRLIQSNK